MGVPFFIIFFMPRQSRIDTPGALHHIIARGIERGKIFKDNQDRFDFIKNLGLILEQTETACYAWSLIPNHFHLLLRTGMVPIATVMRRILTGHAVRFNRRHRRHGHLFQNRYKSILCQEDTYLLELIRYIHLNPLRARLVDNLNQLDKYAFSGHSVIMGEKEQSWQECDEILKYFAKRKGIAKRKYREFVAKGIEDGKRDDLTGGGLKRSMGGWQAVKELKESNVHMKSDERILGDSDFVLEVLSKAEEVMEEKCNLKASGVDIDYIAKRVAAIMEISEEDVWRKGKYNEVVRARSLLCYWAVRELGESMTSMAGTLNISAVAVSKSVERGYDIVMKKGLKLIS
jgi:putative transposase